MASDSQVVLDVDGPRVTIVREKASWSSSGVWRTCGVLLAVALCAAAAVCFSQNKVRRRNRDVTPLCSVLIFTSSITQLLFLSRSFNRRRTNQTRLKVSSIQSSLKVHSSLFALNLLLKFGTLTFLFSLRIRNQALSQADFPDCEGCDPSLR